MKSKRAASATGCDARKRTARASGGRRPDFYASQAQAAGYRSRAVYKLMEIDRRDQLLKPGYCVLDLGAAPGSWSQYAAAQTRPAGWVLSVDSVPIQPIPGVQLLQADVTAPEALRQCRKILGARRCDLVLSDLSPGLSGIRDADQARMRVLAEQALRFARELLSPNGRLLIKLFHGSECEPFRALLRRDFGRVLVRKPRASRAPSREIYLLAREPIGCAAH